MTIKKRLDRSRSAGEIHPPLPHEKNPKAVAHYVQDGFYFDHDGKVLEDFVTEEQMKVIAAKEKAQEKAGEADEEETESDPSRALTRAEKRAQEAPQRPSGSDDLNLETWLRGEEKYPEFRVKKVVRDRYNRVFQNIGDLIEFLVKDVNLMRIDDIKEEYRKMLVPPAVAAE